MQKYESASYGAPTEELLGKVGAVNSPNHFQKQKSPISIISRIVSIH